MIPRLSSFFTPLFSLFSLPKNFLQGKGKIVTGVALVALAIFAYHLLIGRREGRRIIPQVPPNPQPNQPVNDLQPHEEEEVLPQVLPNPSANHNEKLKQIECQIYSDNFFDLHQWFPPSVNIDTTIMQSSHVYKMLEIPRVDINLLPNSSFPINALLLDVVDTVRRQIFPEGIAEVNPLKDYIVNPNYDFTVERCPDWDKTLEEILKEEEEEAEMEGSDILRQMRALALKIHGDFSAWR